MMTRGDSILLVQHVHPVTNETWWVPPGGGVEECDGSVFDCARREVFEETGLSVDLTQIMYVREFIDREDQCRHLELFIGSSGFDGELTIRNVQGNGPDEHYIRDVRWANRSELPAMTIYPEIIKDRFWDDLAAGIFEAGYLGTQIG
jgi:ADP-ribose pyrophosphatase YjhB (NUDIX family)